MKTYVLILPDRYPTEQGLKPKDYWENIDVELLPDRYPTEQGLKLQWAEVAFAVDSAPRPISNRTRIETAVTRRRTSINFDSQTDIQQNKD